MGRSIFSNFHLIRDMLDMIDKTNETGILVKLDKEKSFDRVDHDFLMRVLFKFGFGLPFRGWVSLFYKNVFFSYYLQRKFVSAGFSWKGSETTLSYLPPFIRFGLQNPDRERTNQGTGICLRLGLPYNNIQLSPEGEVNSGGYISRREASRYISTALHRP